MLHSVITSIVWVTFLVSQTTVALAADVPAIHEAVTVRFEHLLPNVPGKRMIAVVVDYLPGGKSLPHRHAPSAFIYAYVLAGAIRSQVNEEPVRIYHTGEHFYEAPGTRHKISENASTTEPAKLLAVFVVDVGEKLTIPDAP